MLIFAGLYLAVSIVLVVIATKRAPEMAFETRTHPAHECEIIDISERIFKAEDRRAA